MSSGRKSELHHEGWKNRPPFIAVDIEQFMETFRPKFSTSASKQHENKEAREQDGHYFGARVSTSEGTKAPTNVRPAASPWQEVKDAVAFHEAQQATEHEIQANTLALKRNKEKWQRGNNGST